MQTFKHSPIPWHVGVSIDKSFGEPWPVDRLREMENIDPSGEEVQANRALIEAAPDLLAAVQHLRICAQCAEGDLNDCDGGRAALAAIAKAEGGAA